MRDRVADVLAERATLDHGAAAGFTLSVVLHAGLAALAIYAALHKSTPQAPNVLNIKFQPMPQPVKAAPPRIAKPAKPAPAPVPVPITPTPIAPPKPDATKNTAPPDAFGRSTKKPAETTPLATPPPRNPATNPATPQPQQSNPGTVANINDIAAGTSAVTGIEGGDFPYTIYIDRMKTLVGLKWYRPQGVSAGVATIHFYINRDGSVRDATLETASGNATFDRAALRAVVEASPLPPLPFGYNGTNLGVHLTFK